MYLCDFSTNDYRCDICIKKASDGFELIVAANRPIGVVPRSFHHNETGVPSTSYLLAKERQLMFLKHCEREAIGLGFDGKIINLASEEELLKMVKQLKKAGYRVPLIYLMK